MNKMLLTASIFTARATSAAFASMDDAVSDDEITHQRAELVTNTDGN
jgi:hypothetical protein